MPDREFFVLRVEVPRVGSNLACDRINLGLRGLQGLQGFLPKSQNQSHECVMCKPILFHSAIDLLQVINPDSSAAITWQIVTSPLMQYLLAVTIKTIQAPVALNSRIQSLAQVAAWALWHWSRPSRHRLSFFRVGPRLAAETHWASGRTPSKQS